MELLDILILKNGQIKIDIADIIYLTKKMNLKENLLFLVMKQEVRLFQNIKRNTLRNSQYG